MMDTWMSMILGLQLTEIEMVCSVELTALSVVFNVAQVTLLVIGTFQMVHKWMGSQSTEMLAGQCSLPETEALELYVCIAMMVLQFHQREGDSTVGHSTALVAYKQCT